MKSPAAAPSCAPPASWPPGCSPWSSSPSRGTTSRPDGPPRPRRHLRDDPGAPGGGVHPGEYPEGLLSSPGRPAKGYQGLTTGGGGPPSVEIKRRAEHSSPEVKRPPLPKLHIATDHTADLRTSGRGNGEHGGHGDPHRTSRARRAADQHPASAGGGGHGAAAGRTARLRLRRGGCGGHTSVVRGRPDGALRSAPGLEERSGPGTHR
ncbi:hypothetical protein SBRY_70013 [Actinacidiphila bryophytorum]|uniref:Uncharacterized protein n=1 Tax=Actinacidiphila bryophytorum TaxID=1436133 RepID=A0A9W4H6W7_9ACTN|nr:hypothetical protein SBRY_70013 [Actinacidiphila bryophytorum]